MADVEPTVVSHAVRHGREYVEYSDGSQWTRKVDRKTGKPRSEWTAIEAPVAQETEPATLYLCVVVQHQAENDSPTDLTTQGLLGAKFGRSRATQNICATSTPPTPIF
ncbi:hypothetical protein J3458_020673 [Metarhizium acridum]|uniref:uncharacterized protein n=1 Tax=Metarhizium acridum TaxID=92637 RepID=UPI001C6C1D27|nr:hypothetical protein J3458_020673 [Metarhizium acridum]